MLPLRLLRLLPLLPPLFLISPNCAHADATPVRYACDDGSTMAVVFSVDGEGRPFATLNLLSATLVLPQVPAASGELFRDGDVRLHTKGDDAYFDDGQSKTRRCSRGEAPAPASASPATVSAASSFVDLGGNVVFSQRAPLPGDAVLIVRIQDTARADARALTLAEQRIELGNHTPPIPFRVVVDRDLIGPKAKVTAAGRIESRGRLLYISNTVTPAMVDGQARNVELKLVPVSAKKH